MYNLSQNNYNLKPKNSTIYTPPEVSEFIFNLLKETMPKQTWILDPCSGMGSLLKPWEKTGYRTWSYDIDPNSTAGEIGYFLTYEEIDENMNDEHILILCNPPFNSMKPKLAPEIWLDKIIELFGKDIPLVFFAPVGLRICNAYQGARYQKFITGKYPPISSIITIPRTTFLNVEFHSEILIFNIPHLQPHYFFNHHGK